MPTTEHVSIQLCTAEHGRRDAPQRAAVQSPDRAAPSSPREDDELADAESRHLLALGRSAQQERAHGSAQCSSWGAACGAGRGGARCGGCPARCAPPSPCWWACACACVLLWAAAALCVRSLVAYKGSFVMSRAAACAETWEEPPTRLLWMFALAARADRQILPHLCASSGGGGALSVARAYGAPDRPIGRGEVVAVRTMHLAEFASAALNASSGLLLPSSRFSLVSWGYPETDLGVPGAVVRPTVAEALLSHPALAGWWSTNALDTRVRPVPLGLNYDDLALHAQLQRALKPRHLLRPWALLTPQRPPAAQEAELLALRAALPPPERKLPLAWADFQFDRDNPERLRLWAALRERPYVAAPARRMRRSELWAAKGRHLFDLSPRGHGDDTYRTWEALALGMVPVVQAHPVLDALHRTLPVVIVRDFAAELNEANLSAWARRLVPKLAGYMRPSSAAAAASGGLVGVPRELTTDYWLEVMRAAARSPRPDE